MESGQVVERLDRLSQLREIHSERADDLPVLTHRLQLGRVQNLQRFLNLPRVKRQIIVVSDYKATNKTRNSQLSSKSSTKKASQKTEANASGILATNN